MQAGGAGALLWDLGGRASPADSGTGLDLEGTVLAPGGPPGRGSASLRGRRTSWVVGVSALGLRR